MCSLTCELVDHHFIQCPFSKHIWCHFVHLFHVSNIPSSISNLWASWRVNLQPSMREVEDLLIKVVTWHIWLERNEQIFNSNSLSTLSVIMKIDYAILLWISVALEGEKLSRRFHLHHPTWIGVLRYLVLRQLEHVALVRKGPSGVQFSTPLSIPTLVLPCQGLFMLSS